MKEKNRIQTPVWFINLQYIILMIYLWFLGIYLKEMIQGNVEMNHPFRLFLLSLIVLFLISSHVYYHEFVHFLSAKVCGYKAHIIINRKRKRKVCYIRGKIKPLHFMFIAIMPFVIDLLIYIILIFVFPDLILFASLILVLAIAGASSDIWMFFSGIPWMFRKGVYFRNTQKYFSIHKETH